MDLGIPSPTIRFSPTEAGDFIRATKTSGMIILLSPSKTLDESEKVPLAGFSEALFPEKTARLLTLMRKKSPKALAALMGISQQLAMLNHQRYQHWHTENAFKKQAIFMFSGDVYSGLQAHRFSADELHYAQQHLRILSGLYGYLQPLDLIQAHRLEMGTPVSVGKSRNLPAYWQKEVNRRLEAELSASTPPLLVNLASLEYFQVIDEKKLGGKCISPVFKDFSNGQYKVVSLFAKKARGAMAAFIIRHKISDPEHLLAFNDDNYCYNPGLSEPNRPVFTRG